MADGITLKRIVDLVAQTEVDDTVYTIIDSVSGTVKKYPIGSLICSIAPIFDSTAAYLAGAYCNYNGQLYVFTEDHDAGAWTGSDATPVTLTDIAEAHGGDLAELEAAVTALETAVEGKADSGGVYENLTSGNALQLASNKGVENSAPYFFRPVPADATREEVEVVGGSVGWNQLVDSETESVTVTSGHKVYTVISGTASVAQSDGSAISVTGGTDMVVDLTTLLGPTIADYIYAMETAHAGDGVAWFQKYFGTGYKAYSAPTIKSVEGVSAHKLVGFNQWDGTYTANTRLKDAYDGTTESAANYGLTGYIPVIPNTTYYNTRTDSGRNLFYDADKNVINPGSAAPVPSSAGTFTTPANCHFVRLTIYVNWLPTFCLNVSDPTRNGQYEPYTVHTYAMDDSVTLRGIPKLDASGNLYFDGDVYPPSGEVQRRYDIVDLGTLDYSYNSATATPYFYTSASGIGAKRNTTDLVAPGYTPKANFAGSAGNDKCIYVTPESLAISNSGYTDAAAFKTAMSGVYMVYPLQTPTTESATPYTTPQICAPGGTEEFVTTGVVPVGHRTWYPTNQVGKLDGLPADFSTLIAPTEKSTTASRAYSIGDYFILNNVLYKVVSAIASGGTITPGTNCTATTIMAEIAAL